MIAEDVKDYISYLGYEKHFSAHTLTAYGRDLEQFSDFMANNYGVSGMAQVKPQHVRTWLVGLMNQGNDPRSVARKLSALRGFCRFLLKDGRLDTNPLTKVQAPKAGKKLPVFVEEGNMHRLFDSREIDHEPVFPDTFEGHRDRLMLLLFYTCGIRLSELIGLRQTDVNPFRRTIKVLGKRNKERIIPFTKELGTELDLYMGYKKAEGLENDYLFVLSSGGKLYPKKVYNIVKHYLSIITTIEKRSPHVLRHTYATHLLNRGADLNAIKELLGHASLAATQVYTHNSIDRLKNIHKTRHPRA